MKVLLSTTPGRTTEKWPPLGLLYIAANLRKLRGDQVTVVDAFCLNMDKVELLERIEREHPDVLGMSCSTHTFLDAIAVLEEVKRRLPDTVIILGGYHATFTSTLIINEYDCIDYIVLGEGELTVPALLDHIERGADPSDVDGICCKRGRGVIQNPPRLIEDLDLLPFPDRDMLGTTEYGYAHQGIPLTFGKFTTICTSRGCPYRCTYCSCSAFFKGKWRKRSPENVVRELEEIWRKGYKTCVLIDDNFTQDRQRVLEICRLIDESGISMKLYCEGRADRVDYELLKRMKKAGFDVIYFGVESASQHVLDYYNKRFLVQETKDAITTAKKVGMLVIASFIIGAPNELEEDMLRSIDFIKNTRPHGVQMNVLDCLVGTPLWKELGSMGLLSDGDWKTNHRIYEYGLSKLSKNELDSMVDMGYRVHIDGWRSVKGIRELAWSFLLNRTLREIVIRNLTNPAARRRLSWDFQLFERK